jgi:hypothetical protein
MSINSLVEEEEEGTGAGTIKLFYFYILCHDG